MESKTKENPYTDIVILLYDLKKEDLEPNIFHFQILFEHCGIIRTILEQ